MNEDKNLLMPYVMERVNAIMTDKRNRNIRPLIATESEIIANIRADVSECMKSLHKSKDYVLTHTLNLPALIPMDNAKDD